MTITMYRWVRNEESPPKLTANECVGSPVQSTFIDPLGKGEFVHKGRSVEELTQEGYVGVYITLKHQEKIKMTKELEQAYDAGWAAFKTDKKNPYTCGTKQSMAWECGRDDAYDSYCYTEQGM